MSASARRNLMRSVDKAIRILRTGDAREGQRVKILGGMKEFIGKTGRIKWKEGSQYRVELDSPVNIPGVGEVSDDLWDSNLLRKIGD